MQCCRREDLHSLSNRRVLIKSSAPLIKQKAPLGGLLLYWRRERDSNPRTGISRYTISNRALSTTQPPLQNSSPWSSLLRKGAWPYLRGRLLRLNAAGAELAVAGGGQVLLELSWIEEILVDDGSDEATWQEVQKIHKGDPRWKAVRFSRNFGHQTAVSAGIA